MRYERLRKLFLASNIALELSLQYRSVAVFSKARIVTDPEEARRCLYGLISKYCPLLPPGKELRPITDNELKRKASILSKLKNGQEKKIGRRKLFSPTNGRRCQI